MTTLDEIEALLRKRGFVSIKQKAGDDCGHLAGIGVECQDAEGTMHRHAIPVDGGSIDALDVVTKFVVWRDRIK